MKRSAEGVWPSLSKTPSISPSADCGTASISPSVKVTPASWKLGRAKKQSDGSRGAKRPRFPLEADRDSPPPRVGSALLASLHQCAREVDSVMAEFCKESGRTTEFRNLESPLSIRKSIVEVVSVAPVKADPELEDRIDRSEELIFVQAEILMNEIRHIRRAPSPHPRR